MILGRRYKLRRILWDQLKADLSKRYASLWQNNCWRLMVLGRDCRTTRSSVYPAVAQTVMVAFRQPDLDKQETLV